MVTELLCITWILLNLLNFVFCVLDKCSIHTGESMHSADVGWSALKTSIWLVNSVVQFFVPYCFSICSIIERGVLKSASTIVDLPVCSLILSFCA